MTEMKEEKEGRMEFKFLRWPWNIIIYIALILALRIFAIPVILLLVWFQQKHNPHGALDGYCLSRTRKRLFWLLWALLLFLISASLCVVFYVEGWQTRLDWQTKDAIEWIVCACMAAALFVGGCYMAFVGVRDAFFPAKSSLAKSIQTQLPNPENALSVRELFAMVDNDLQQNGRWFESFGIGKEWTLGEEANRIERIRGIFTVDEIHQSSTQTGVRSRRTLQLALIDNRWKKTVVNFRNPKELQAAADCLALQQPDAFRGRNGQCLDFLHYDNLKQEAFEREFLQKKSSRMSDRLQQEFMRGGAQDMILRQFDGTVTSRVTKSLVEERLKQCLAGNETDFTLTPTRPIAWNRQFCRELRCFTKGNANAAALTVELTDENGGKKRTMELETDAKQAQKILENWLLRQPPNLTDWTARSIR